MSGRAAKQDVATPRLFIDAVEQRFGRISFDLAATRDNAVCEEYAGPDHRSEDLRDSLVLDWDALGAGHDLLWLNPPFSNIPAWAAKAAGTSQVTIAMLAPASVCTKWFIEQVAPHAYVLELTPRVFAREIRDCILALYTPQGYVGRETWRWR